MIASMGAGSSTEAQRILGLYKRLVLLGKAKLPLAEARRLVGPDCAFHLYFRHETPSSSPPAGARAPGARRRARRRRRHG
jgi:hypothetical protein